MKKKGDQVDTPVPTHFPEKATLKNPSLIKVKREIHRLLIETVFYIIYLTRINWTRRGHSGKCLNMPL